MGCFADGERHAGPIAQGTFTESAQGREPGEHGPHGWRLFPRPSRGLYCLNGVLRPYRWPGFRATMEMR
jgi:hypothetical protein